ncbi:hypothetical protein DFH08DRAFT_807987 [Mycena albidolilacea]|uniref:Uncharacterized protein n=1 Tax=Mycena albidolilacea TaxID=1033008 RepID=A0AAD7A3H6_9AGAR|nr:hypothetical protein DFH08DRAFT_807987 [Mycena albidolilacea]
MPPRTFATVDKILEYTLAAGNVLQEVAGATQIPFLKRICTFTSTIIPMVQNTKFQKEHSLQIVECIHHLLCVLRSLSIQSEDIQSPQMLHKIAQVAVTLQKVDSCLRAQQELGTIRRLFKQSELIGQLDACETELNVVLTSFTVTKIAKNAEKENKNEVENELKMSNFETPPPPKLRKWPFSYSKPQPKHKNEIKNEHFSCKMGSQLHFA